VTRGLEHENRAIVDLLQDAIDGLITVYRFGSTVDGRTHQGSDTDIAVLSRVRLSPVSRFEIQERLAAELGRDVDLVDLTAASPVLAIQVVAHGQVLYEGDAAARGQFEDLTFGRYARLNEERRGILERIAAEGTVYGR
jgi:uncharacterized protein